MIVINLEPTPKSKLPQNVLKSERGSWKTAHVFFEETSGPVAPEFLYAIQVQIEANKKGFFITKESSAAKSERKQIKKRLTEESYSNLLNKFIKLNAHKLPYEEMPKEKITGVSYNTFSFQLGTKKSRFYYMLSELNKEEFKQKKEIIQIMKRIKL